MKQELIPHGSVDVRCPSLSMAEHGNGPQPAHCNAIWVDIDRNPAVPPVGACALPHQRAASDLAQGTRDEGQPDRYCDWGLPREVASVSSMDCVDHVCGFNTVLRVRYGY